MANIRYMHRKDSTHRLICKTLHEHNSKVMRKLNIDVSKKRMLNHIKRLMRRQVRKDESIKVLDGSGCTVSDKQEVLSATLAQWGERSLSERTAQVRFPVRPDKTYTVFC